jgi:prepilin-type N-terminal cleavage/methylation domain-containing protein
VRLLEKPGLRGVAQAILPAPCGVATQSPPRRQQTDVHQKHAVGPSLHLSERRWFLARRRGGRSGMTLIELIVAFTILLILSTMALPLARVRVQHAKERRLHDALSEMRKAIDRYKDYADAGKLGQIDPDSFGYPESLDKLVEGVEISGEGAAGMGMPGTSNFGQPAGQSNRSRGSGFGSNRGGSRGSGFGSGSSGFGSSGGGFGSSGNGFGSSGGFGQSSNRGMGSSNSSGFGSSRGSSGLGATGKSDSDDEPKKIRFLRSIPVDPMTGTADWGMRSVTDPPESMSWGGRNVFDVYSKSMETALDGTRYSEW